MNVKANVMDGKTVLRTISCDVAMPTDPEILKAAKTMDVKALMANQKFVNAIKNPAVKEIDKKLKGQ